MTKKVALLRAVNVGGRKMPMAELRALCTELGWGDVSTYIQSGNVVFSAEGEAAALEEQLEHAIHSRFGLIVPVIVRSARQWALYAAEKVFPTSFYDIPGRLILLLSKLPPKAGAIGELTNRASAGERMRQSDEALWIHYPQGVGSSKLTPSLIDRAVGSPATGRNYRTVQKLQEMLTS